MINMILMGNVGKDAVVKTFDNDRAVVNFTVAHSEKWTDKQGTKHENTIWVECALWRTHAQANKIAPYLVKGTKLFLTGKPEPRAWVKDGAAVAGQGMTVISFEFAGSAKAADGSTPTATKPAANAAPSYAPPVGGGEDDDLPF